MTGSPDRRKPINCRKRKAIVEEYESDITSPAKSSYSFGSCSYSSPPLNRYIPTATAEEIPVESRMTFREFYLSRSGLKSDQIGRIARISERKMSTPVELPESDMIGSSNQQLPYFGGLNLYGGEDNHLATSPPANYFTSFLSMLVEVPSSDPLPQSPSPPPPPPPQTPPPPTPLQIAPRVFSALNIDPIRYQQLLRFLTIKNVEKYKERHKNDDPCEGVCTHSSKETIDAIFARLCAKSRLQ